MCCELSNSLQISQPRSCALLTVPSWKSSNGAQLQQSRKRTAILRFRRSGLSSVRSVSSHRLSSCRKRIKCSLSLTPSRYESNDAIKALYLIMSPLLCYWIFKGALSNWRITDREIEALYKYLPELAQRGREKILTRGSVTKNPGAN